MPAVSIVDTRLANIASILAAMERLGLDARIVDAPAQIASADRLILPGVGSFGAAMERLRALGVVDALRERIESDRPTLCVCLGMQLLFESSEESPGVEGLSVVPGAIRRFRSPPRRTHFGWSAVTLGDERTIVQPGYAYFAHSYCATDAPADWSTSRAALGEPFIASIQRGTTLACQFHPELSGAWGLSLLARWAGVQAPLTTQTLLAESDA